MRTRNSTCLRIGAALAAWLVILSSAPRSADSLLIRIDKRQRSVVPSAVMAQMTAIQELATAWLVEIPAPLVTRLNALRLSFDTLDDATQGKTYYLVYAARSDQIEALSEAGNVRLLEDGIGLFWADTEDARERVPADVSLKRLSGRIRTPISFLLSGRARAVERASSAATWAPYDPRIAEMVGQVSTSQIRSLITGLQNFQTRYASTTKCEESGAAIFNSFQEYGLDTEADPFAFSVLNYTTSNIVATLPGRVEPDRVVIVCAHYDSYSNQARTDAPGADDNASGTAAVMEIARILAGYQFDFTVRFIAFSAEEWGLYGSRHYAQAARQRGESIVGVINLDMIGFVDAEPEDLNLFVNDRSDWLGNQFAASAARYAPLDIVKSINASVTGSDHSPFWDQGYSALLGIEDYPLRNPNYHRPSDTIDTLNLDFAAAVTRASLALVAELAQPPSPVAAPTGVRATNQIIRSLFSGRKMVVLTWNASAGSIAGYNVYRSPTSHGAYQRVNPSLVRTMYYVDRLLPSAASYFYVVTAVDTQGRESHYSVEVQ